jgi:hypothetical protein
MYKKIKNCTTTVFFVLHPIYEQIPQFVRPVDAV